MTKATNNTVINDAMIVPETQYIQLSKLVVSPLNVRTIDANKQADKELLASIRKNGVIQNLVVINKGNKYEVVAGGRRLATLLLLLEAKEIKKTYPVNCLVAGNADDATRLSLVENINRADMHIVEQLRAFNSLISEGSTIADISVSFGFSKVHVKRILALAVVNPIILDAFANGDLKMDALEAFTVTDNHDLQLECFESNTFMNPSNIRRMLTESGYSSTSKIAKFVGKADYKKAGGVVIPDLFKTEENFADGDILRDLAREKLCKLIDAEPRNKGYQWIEWDTTGSFDSDDYGQMRGEYRGVPEALEKQLAEAEETYRSLDWDSDENETVELLIDSLNAEKDDYLFFSFEQMKYSGVVATYDVNGVVSFRRGLTRGDDMQNYLNSIEKPKSEAQADSDTDIEGETMPKEKGLSQALQDNLNLHDVQLTQLNMLQNPQISSEAFIFDTCYDLLSGDGSYHYGKIFATETKNVINHSDDLVIETWAYKEIKKLKDAINTEWLKDNVQDSYEAFCELNTETQLIIFGQVVALSANASHARSDERSIYEPVFLKSNFEKSKYFTPTKANYFGRLSLEPLRELCTELFGEDWVTERNSLARGKLAVNAEESYLELEDQYFLPEPLIVESSL
jgi:ParB family chromosome partitioning protein